jgi:hypothetical protein
VLRNLALDGIRGERRDRAGCEREREPERSNLRLYFRQPICRNERHVGLGRERRGQRRGRDDR